MRTKTMLTIGQSLKKCREKAGITQADLAKMTGQSAATIANWEKDKAAMREIYMICDIADVLNVSLDNLVGRRFKKK